MNGIAIPGYVFLQLVSRNCHETYLACQVDTLRTVLVCVAGTRDSGKSSLRHKAEMLTRLEHPSITEIVESGETQTHYFIAQEFVFICDLGRRLHNGPLPGSTSARLVRALADALACARQQGLVCEDLGPESIHMTIEGSPKLDNFRPHNPPRQDDLPGICLGIPAYVAPNRFAARPARLSRQQMFTDWEPYFIT